MFDEFIKRENDIFEILEAFIKNGLDFVLIGGYAVSAFKHRFSVDADIVINSKELYLFEKILKESGFKRVILKELKNIYSSKFIRYQKKGGLSVSVDILVDGIGIRQTNNVIGFDKINKNSFKKKIKGLEKEIVVKIPIKELLIAMKIQSGRLTDFRDILVLCKSIDFDKVEVFLKNCDKKILREHVKKLIELLDKKEFIDSFKGVFVEKKFDIDIDDVKKLKNLLK